jgi:adenylate cyclase
LRGRNDLNFIFANHVLDTERRELRCRANLIPVEPQVFDLLEYLIRNRTRVVSKEDVFAAVWHGRIVSESALTSRINSARNAIGDSGDDQHLIKTLRGKGFRFVGAVQEEERSAGAFRELSSASPSNPALLLPDKPSIVVLPFQNMSGDPEQEYFVDGLTEDLITELSRFRSLFVIARNSAFVYRGRSVRVQDVAHDLGVRYVVEGSVRKEGKRIRVTAQLVDAASGSHIWAQRFDRDVEDVFAVQSEVTQSIVALLTRRLEDADLERVIRKQTASLVAYDYVLRVKHHHHRVTKEDNAQALLLVEMALGLDPNYAQAHAWLACTLGQAMHRGFIAPSESESERSFVAAETARSLDDNDAECHRILCEINLIRKDFDRAEYHQQRALSLNPNDPSVVAQRGYLMTCLGQAPEAVEWIEKALRLDPAQPGDYYMRSLVVLHVAGRYADATQAFSRLATPQFFTHAHVAACLAELNDGNKAKPYVAEVLRARPGFSVEQYAKTLPFKKHVDADHVRAGMLKAGLPR